MVKEKANYPGCRQQKASVHGELRSGPIAGTALIDGATFSQKPVLYAEVDGQAIFEGDIVLGTVQSLKQAQGQDLPLRSIGITGQQFRWPNATIPYEIDPALPNQQRVTDAIAHWEAHTRIRFVLRTAANQSQFPDFVRFVPGGGCSSMVGRQGGQQNVTLGANCTSGNAIHEIGHSVGLWHEQSREDRDSFVTIVWANIDPSMQFNFSQHIQDGDDLGAYDYGSIMHYPRDAFSINGQDTIVPKQASAGRRGHGAAHAPFLPETSLVFRSCTRERTTFKEVPKGSNHRSNTQRKYPKSRFRTRSRKCGRIRSSIAHSRKFPRNQFETRSKRSRKDPITETTAKEVALDPVPGPGPVVNPPDQVFPFVLASPSRAFPGGTAEAGNAMQHLQELEEAIRQVEQQLAELMTAYDEAVKFLQGS